MPDGQYLADIDAAYRVRGREFWKALGPYCRERDLAKARAGINPVLAQIKADFDAALAAAHDGWSRRQQERAIVGAEAGDDWPDEPPF